MLYIQQLQRAKAGQKPDGKVSDSIVSKADKVRQVRLCRPGAARTSQLMTTLATRRQHPKESHSYSRRLPCQ